MAMQGQLNFFLALLKKIQCGWELARKEAARLLLCSAEAVCKKGGKVTLRPQFSAQQD